MTGHGAAPIRRRLPTRMRRAAAASMRERHLAGFSRHPAGRRLCRLQAADRCQARRRPAVLAFCWSHFRRQFYDIAKGGNAPIATEALARIAQLYAIEDEIRGTSADAAPCRSAGPIEAARRCARRPGSSSNSPASRGGSEIAKAIRYGLSHWDGPEPLPRRWPHRDRHQHRRAFNAAAWRLSRKNALFAGSDEGARKLGRSSHR